MFRQFFVISALTLYNSSTHGRYTPYCVSLAPHRKRKRELKKQKQNDVIPPPPGHHLPKNRKSNSRCTIEFKTGYIFLFIISICNCTSNVFLKWTTLCRPLPPARPPRAFCRPKPPRSNYVFRYLFSFFNQKAHLSISVSLLSYFFSKETQKRQAGGQTESVSGGGGGRRGGLG